MSGSSQDSGTGKRWGRIVIGVVLVLLLAFVIRETFRPPANAPRASDERAATRTLPAPEGVPDVRQPMPSTAARGQYVAGNARVEPYGRESRVAAQIPGLIHTILVPEGQRVVRGTPLIQLDAAVEQAAAAATQAEYESEEANLRRVLSGNRREEVASARAEAESAQAKAALAADTLRRTERLSETGASTPQELNRARLDVDADRAAASAAEAKAELCRIGSRKEDIAIARARLAAAKAKLDQANAALAQRTVRAPIDGTVLSVAARLGEYFTPTTSDPLLVMGDLARLRARMEVDERDVGRIRIGAHAYVTADAFGARHFQGTVIDIGRRMGRKTIHTDLPSERPDAEVLEVLIDLDDRATLIPGLRVTGYVEATSPQI